MICNDVFCSMDGRIVSSRTGPENGGMVAYAKINSAPFDIHGFYKCDLFFGTPHYLCAQYISDLCRSPRNPGQKTDASLY